MNKTYIKEEDYWEDDESSDIELEDRFAFISENSESRDSRRDLTINLNEIDITSRMLDEGFDEIYLKDNKNKVICGPLRLGDIKVMGRRLPED